MSDAPSVTRRRAPAVLGRFDGWAAGALVVSGLVAAPLIAVIVLALTPSDDIWSHLLSTVLPLYASNTVFLMTGVGAGTLIIGTATAWLVTMCRFPGRRVFEWLLLLPMAIPAYVIAFLYTDLLEYAGPVQSALRHAAGWTTRRDYWFPDIRSLGGAIAMMTLVLYPYVYLLARAAFHEQSVCVLEVGRTLGRGPWRSFFTIALPLARPAIVVGVALAMMETLSDYGTVTFFEVPTFSAGIYDVWRNMSSVAGAAQLAVVLLVFALILVAAERWARRDRRFHHTTTKYRALPSYRLGGGRAVLAFWICALPVLLGFVLPVGVLIEHSLRAGADSFGWEYLGFAANSLLLSSVSAACAVAVGLLLAYGIRLGRSPLLKYAARIASLGYAVPGAVLAVGVLVPLAAFDNMVDGWMRQLVGVSTGLLLSGTLAAVTFGYVVRFLALAYGAIDASLAKVTPSMDGAARTLGQTPGGALARVHVPIIRGSVLVAAMLVFVDGMKELPMTLIMRPFNFETLATWVYVLGVTERLQDYSPGALVIVAAGVLPIIVMIRTTSRSRPGQGPGQGMTS